MPFDNAGRAGGDWPALSQHQLAFTNIEEERPIHPHIHIERIVSALLMKSNIHKHTHRDRETGHWSIFPHTHTNVQQSVPTDTHT